MDGVLYVGDEAVPGAVDALGMLKDLGVARRFVTNTTTRTAVEVVEKLNRLGFEVGTDEVFSAVTATVQFLGSQCGGSPKLHLLVRESVREEFEAFPAVADDPDFVVVGDIGAA